MSTVDNIDRAISFIHYWHVSLSVRLKNAEMMTTFPKEHECRNDVLKVLIGTYITAAIESALLNVYEGATILAKIDSGFKFDRNDPSDPVALVIKYRNHLLTHREENKHLPEVAALREGLKGSSTKIYRHIEAAMDKLIKHFDHLERNGRFANRESQAYAALEITPESLEELLRAAPVRGR